jgi:hypothetical protein
VWWQVLKGLKVLSKVPKVVKDQQVLKVLKEILV